MSFGDALKELGISENELRAMITRGQLRPMVRGGREMFRRSAIDNLKRASKAQPTVILPADMEKADDEPLPIVSDEPLVLGDEPSPLDFDDQSPTEVPALADEDESSVTAETVMPTIELTPQDRQAAGGDEEHTDVSTQEVSLSDNEEYLILEDGPKAAAAAPQQPASFAPSGEVEEEEEEEDAETEPVPSSMVALLAILTVALMGSMFMFVGAAKGFLPNTGLFGSVSGFLKGILL